MRLRANAATKFAFLERNRLLWPQSCISEKLLLIKRMIRTNRIGAEKTDNKLKVFVNAASAKAEAIKGKTVLKICQVAIRLSLAI